jgi:hypothetical protein
MSQEALYSSLTSFLSALSSHAPKISSCRVRSTLSHVFSRKLRDLIDNSQKKTDIPKSDARENVIFLLLPLPSLLLLLVGSSLKETIELLSLEKEESDEILSGDLPWKRRDSCGEFLEMIPCAMGSAGERQETNPIIESVGNDISFIANDI